MFNQFGRWATVCGIGGIVLFLGATSARAAENYMEITGNVTFEKRSTVVPLGYCVGSSDFHCPKPQRYWTVVFQSGKVRYELEQPFALGSRAAPESIEVDGVLLRPGTRVLLEGLVEPVSEDYAYLTKIRKLNLVMDYNEAVSRNAMMDSETVTEIVYPQWECTGAVGDDAQVVAQVWYTGSGRASKAHKLQVIAENRDGKRVNLAFLQNVGVSNDQDWLIYSGSTAMVTANLAIQQVGAQSTRNYPGILKLKRLQNQNQIVVPLEAAIDLKCAWIGPIR